MKKNKRSSRELSILPGAAVGVKVLTRTVKDKKTGKIKTISDINLALKKFKKEVKASGRLLELKERKFFIPKSERKRVQKERAVYFQQIRSREEQF